MTETDESGERPALPEGSIDCHVHTAPDLINRYESDLQLAHEAAAAGMNGVLVKSHVVPTVGRVDLVNEAFGEELLYGGIALNGSVGGLNRDAVESALELGARVVWLPTVWNENHASRSRAAGESRFVGQRVPGPAEEISVARNGRTTPATREIIELVGEYDATIGTGHASPAQIEAVVDTCAKLGVRCLVNHPFFRVVGLSIDQQVALAEQGAIMEYCAYSVQSTDHHSIDRIVDAVDRIGVRNCLLATDFGQADNPPVSGFSEFVGAVVDGGVPRSDAEAMVTQTPARVLGI